MAIVLRPYQIENKEKIYAEWKADYKNVLLVKATGLGKTKLFCSIAIDLAIKGIWGHKLPSAIMVHRKELVQQISLTLAEEGIPHNIIAPTPVIRGIVAAQRQLTKRQWYDYNANITVISVDTLNSRIAKHEKWAKSIRFWITDEATHLLRENKWGRAVKFFPNAIGLGVTATPERLDKRGLGSHVDGVFDRMVIGPDTRWGIDNGYLCSYKIAIPNSDYQLHLKEANGDSDYTREAMIVASQKSHIVGDVVANYQKFAGGKQAIVFTSDVGAGERMKANFIAKGVKAVLLTALSEDSDRLRSMIDYRDKKIQVLINIDLFDEGLDVPGIECVIMARPTMSLSKYLQMIGRGLRPAKGKEFLVIIDHVGNVKKHGLPDARRRWSLDRVKRRKKNLNLIRICANVECNAPFSLVLRVCPYCKEEVKGPNREGSGRVSPAEIQGDLILLDPDTLRELESKTVLEDPNLVAQRVAKAAGGPAGIRAMHNQIERIAAQRLLVDAIALKAGEKRAEGLTDREIHVDFFLNFNSTISEWLAEPKVEMLKHIEELKEW